uniref:Uncharacterized protein n=1 Tax=Anguilla anguilla TaxID=7936 RepID=A0A0E9T376_ANGAN
MTRRRTKDKEKEEGRGGD